MMHSDNIANTPITELSLKEDIEKRFLEMYTDASDNAQKRISDSRYFRKFFNGDQYNTERPDMSWLGVLRQKNNSHIPRMAGEETFEALFDILPILLKSKPGIAIEAESNPFTREESMEDSLIAEMMTDIYDNLYRIRSQHIFDSNVVLESLISGAAYVTFQKTHDHRGITVQPRLLLPEQFLGDPDGMCAYNFSDYEYIILTTYRTAFEIYQDYGIEEDEYGQGSSIPGKSFGFLGLQMPSRRESRRSGPVDGRYPVHTLFVRPYTPGIDVSLDADEQPKIQKMTFINESYYVEGSRQDNPYWHGDFPVTVFQSLPTSFSKAGMSEVAILMGTQIAVNIARDSSVATALFNANPGYDIEDGAIGKGNIDNTPGGVSEWNNNTMARGAMKPRDPRDSVSQMNLWQMTLQQMRNRKGDSGNLLQGGQPGNIKSGKHYSMSLNNVLTRNGYRVRMLDTAWQRLATQDVSMFQQFVRFNANHLSRNYEIAHELEFLTEIDIAERIREFRYDISIDSKSDMPATIEEKINLFLSLYDRGLVSAQEFYEQTNIKLSPDEREKIELSSDSFVPGLPQGETAALGIGIEQQAEQLAGEI